MESTNPFHIAFSAALTLVRQLGPRSRLEMYQRAREIMAEAVGAAADPAQTQALRAQARELELGIRGVEADLRALRVAQAAGRRAAPAAAPVAPVAPAEDALFPYEGPGPTPLRPRRRLMAGLARRAAGAEALAWRFARLTAAGGPLAYLWLVIEPAIPMAVLIALYLVLGRAEIFDMPAAAFVVIGIGSWFLYRSIFMRLSVGLGGDVQLRRLPRINDVDIYASKALFFTLLYGVMVSVALALLIAMDLAEPPDQFLRIVGLLCCLILTGVSHGLCFGYVAQVFPPVVRIKALLYRLFYLTSGAMFVTEQFPEEVTQYLLYNPFLHCIQLIRDAYFVKYQTHDVSLAYVLSFTLVSLAFGGACLRAAERLPRPA